MTNKRKLDFKVQNPKSIGGSSDSILRFVIEKKRHILIVLGKMYFKRVRKGIGGSHGMAFFKESLTQMDRLFLKTNSEDPKPNHFNKEERKLSKRLMQNSSIILAF